MTTATFTYSYKQAHVNSVQYNTIVDETFTGKEQRRDTWSNPRMSWVLDFEKNQQNKDAIVAFFRARKGRKESFYWTWDANKGGDGQQYTVRFASDALDLNIIETGYSTFSIQFVEVVGE